MKNILYILFAAICIIFTNCKSGVQEPSGSETAATTKPLTDAHGGEKPATGAAEHTIVKLKKQPFSFVLRTGGMILTDSKDIIVITAKSSGILKFSDHFLFPGVKTNRGQLLFTISGDELAEDNTELNFSQIKSDLEKAGANYERAKKLISDKIITEEHFLSLKNEYEKALNEYNNLNGTFGKNGNRVSSPDNGYIRDIFVTEGQKVTAGEQLATIVIQHNLVLKAYISPDNVDLLSSVEKANFSVGYDSRIFKTDELNGRKISFGKSTGENSYNVPVYFRMDYTPSLIEGTFADVYLIGKEIKDALVVPNTALMEEYGKLYVFVDDGDGDFFKRYIKTGYNNGEQTQVIEGLAENEMIVATGTYQVKLSQMTTSAPAHNH
jgi:cobalt-zinc-cadmium efflux system membrane fusion protein